MDQLQKILDQIYHAPDSKIRTLAEAFFARLEAICREKSGLSIFVRIPQLRDDPSLWDVIHASLGGLLEYLDLRKCDRNEKAAMRARILRSFCNLAETRKNKIKDALLALPPQSMPYYLALTNIHKNRFRQEAGYFWEQFNAGNYGDLEFIESLLTSKKSKTDFQLILQELRNISHNISRIEETDHQAGEALRYRFDALDFAISQHFKNSSEKKCGAKAKSSRAKQYALNDFENCEMCWRFVPKNATADGKKPFCKWHAYDPSMAGPRTGYNLARGYAHNKVIKSGLPGRTADIYNRLRKYMPVEDGPITRQDWHNALCSRLSLIDLDAFPTVEYVLDRVWYVCPNVHRYIKENGGNDQSPESILEILDPETEGETEEFRHERKCLHKFLAKNFALYRLELAKAESFLSDEYSYKDAHPRGGQRPGTGGRRPGSGRKPKKR